MQFSSSSSFTAILMAYGPVGVLFANAKLLVKMAADPSLVLARTQASYFGLFMNTLPVPFLWKRLQQNVFTKMPQVAEKNVLQVTMSTSFRIYRSIV